MKVNELHLTSAYDRRKEAQQQISLLPDNPLHIHVYGFALGDLLSAVLEKFSCEVTVYILNLIVFREVISRLDLRLLFSDERITLMYSADVIDSKEPFVASPACLQFADNDCLKLRDEIQIKLASAYISESYNKYREVWLKQIIENFSNIQSDIDISKLFARHSNDECVVVAAGPSLSSLFDELKQLQRQGTIIIAVDAALKPLVQQRIEPDYVLTVDGQRDKLIKFYEPEILDKLKKAKLVYLPVVHSDVLNLWPNDRYCGYANLDIYKVVEQRFPRGRLYLSGSVVHPAVDLAVKMGCKKVYFAGMDFGYPNYMSHVSGSYYEQKIERVGHERKLVNGNGEYIFSIQNLIVYLRDLERYLLLQHDVEFINMSRSGAMINSTKYMDE